MSAATTPRFHEIQEHVEKYVEDCLANGQNLTDIVDSFRHDPLPVQLTTGDYTDDELKRHGQLVSTRYLLLEREKSLANIQEEDTDPRPVRTVEIKSQNSAA